MLKDRKREGGRERKKDVCMPLCVSVCVHALAHYCLWECIHTLVVLESNIDLFHVFVFMIRNVFVFKAAQR